MPQMEFLQRSVVTSVHFGVAALTAPGSALAGTARRELRALGMRDAVLTELLPLAGRGGAPVGAVGTGERSRVLTHQGTQLLLSRRVSKELTLPTRDLFTQQENPYVPNVTGETSPF